MEKEPLGFTTPCTFTEAELSSVDLAVSSLIKALFCSAALF